MHLKLMTATGGTIRTVHVNAFGSEAKTRAYLAEEKDMWERCASVLGLPELSSLRVVER
jgi:hypothetical protein